MGVWYRLVNEPECLHGRLASPTRALDTYSIMDPGDDKPSDEKYQPDRLHMTEDCDPLGLPEQDSEPLPLTQLRLWTNVWDDDVPMPEINRDTSQSQFDPDHPPNPGPVPTPHAETPTEPLFNFGLAQVTQVPFAPAVVPPWRLPGPWRSNPEDDSAVVNYELRAEQAPLTTPHTPEVHWDFRAPIQFSRTKEVAFAYEPVQTPDIGDESMLPPATVPGGVNRRSLLAENTAAAPPLSRRTSGASDTTSGSRKSSRSRKRKLDTPGSDGNRWSQAPSNSAVGARSQGPRPVRAEGSFVYCETPGAGPSSEPNMASTAELGQSRSTTRRRYPNLPTRSLSSSNMPQDNRNTAIASPHGNPLSVDPTEEAFFSALAADSDLPRWVTQDLWQECRGDVASIREGFRRIPAQWAHIAQATGAPIWVVQGAWLAHRGDMLQILEAIRQHERDVIARFTGKH
ncbi:hypothetical protein FIBSPDRAFT_895630 [Athelia psychrophila]|uniref:Uncharacterized protein n=1 Tax=Athelia psychrophila TaxID=1759441 RepID=A0A166ECR7_9AGAM|nr:hypothetical protein FIBSPDRAFT_895630 [Fibularhizoctonia sp. CBS 109695]